MLSIIKQAPSADPDGDIIPALARGDERAFTQLMDRHLKTINNLAAYMLGDPFMAEDVTQSTFLRTWQMMPSWQPGQAKLITWMRRVATNLCLDILKKKRPVFMDTLPEVTDISDLPDAALLAGDDAKMVGGALAALPDRQRLALTLSYYQNVSQSEGAEIMNISISAYESLLVRARKALKAAVTNDPMLKLQAGERI